MRLIDLTIYSTLKENRLEAFKFVTKLMGENSN